MEEIRKIEINDNNYPKSLKEISESPQALYYKGEIKKDELSFAVVGTRRFSPYGKQITLEISSDLAEAGLVIVSGLAPGIDTFAHTAVKNSGSSGVMPVVKKSGSTLKCVRSVEVWSRVNYFFSPFYYNGGSQ